MLRIHAMYTEKLMLEQAVDGVSPKAPQAYDPFHSSLSKPK
jgi:hypothetical protein